MQPFHESNVAPRGHHGAVQRFTPPCPRKRHGTSPMPLMPLNRCGLAGMKNTVLQLVASLVPWRIPFQQDDIPMPGTRRPHGRGCASEFTRHWWLFMERDAWRVGQARGAFPRHGGRCPNRRLWDSGQRDALVLCKPRTACFHGQIQSDRRVVGCPQFQCTLPMKGWHVRGQAGLNCALHPIGTLRKACGFSRGHPPHELRKGLKVVGLGLWF